MNKTKKQFKDMSNEELVSLFSTIIKDNMDDMNFNMQLVNNTFELYLPYTEEENKKVYDYCKYNTNYNYRFLIKPIHFKLYEYIKKDIEENNFEHKVILLPHINTKGE